MESSLRRLTEFGRNGFRLKVNQFEGMTLTNLKTISLVPTKKCNVPLEFL